MGKELIILTDWTDKSDYQKLKTEIEKVISSADSFTYLFCIQKAKEVEELPHIPKVHYISKRDFSFFGKLKTIELKKILQKKDSGILIGTSKLDSKLYKRVLKKSKLISIGTEKESLPYFNISFKDTNLKGDDFYKKINNYLTKIQL